METNQELQELKSRMDQIDREIGVLQSERLIKGLRFQALLRSLAVTPTNIPVRPLYEPSVLARTGFEDSPMRKETL